MPAFPALPIVDVLPSILDALSGHSSCILEAPPGAGKTTIVPLALLDAPWLKDRRIILLEPRRLAARAAARRMADLLGEDAGRTVGYRMRMDTKVSSSTRIEVVTEGILTRMLSSDPTLGDTAIVIFDEFHERSLQADTGLGLCLLGRDLGDTDLRIMVMSATLSSLDRLRTLLPEGTPVVRSEGRMYPVETTYMTSPPARHLDHLMSAAIIDALHDHEGDILCFLPGTSEIRRTLATASASLDKAGIANVDLIPLYGDLDVREQDRALRPSGPSRRKVVLATSIAETSITIDGVRVVIDGGRSREPRFDPRIGMSRLVTVPVSRDAAEQRRGRAGRTAEGTCIRLWTRTEQEQLPERRLPEILTADLAPLALDLAAFGASVQDVPWIDTPPDGHYRQAIELLRELHALDDHGNITSDGREMARMAMHPRMAHMVRSAPEARRMALILTVLLGERDILRAGRDADLRRRVAIIDGMHDDQADMQAVRAARQRLSVLERNTSDTVSRLDMDSCGRIMSLAYPDRIARRKAVASSSPLYLMRNGRTARLYDHDSLIEHEWLAIAALDGTAGDIRIALAAPMTEEDVMHNAAEDIVTVPVFGWDDDADFVIARIRRSLGAIVLQEYDDPNAEPYAIAAALAEHYARNDWKDLPWTNAARILHRRMTFSNIDIPMSVWTEALVGCRKRKDVERIDVLSILDNAMSWEERQRLDRLAPTHYTVPNGRRIAIDYSDPERPVLAVRLQDMFGVKTQPRVADGRIVLTVHLLSPAGRPIQVTQDIGGFWSGSYAEVRKEMRGRYPKHKWPEDPTTM